MDLLIGGMHTGHSMPKLAPDHFSECLNVRQFYPRIERISPERRFPSP